MITRYTLGFIFSKDLKEVLLLKMNKPGKWNDGLINGVGGHVEAGEGYQDCMLREGQEETGIIAPWNYVGVYDGSEHTHNEFKVFTYYTVVDKSKFDDKFQSPEGDLAWYNVDDIMKLKTVPNMKWMIPYCLDKINHNIHTNFNIKYCNAHL